MQVLVVGALLAPRKRTVTACLRVMGLSQETHVVNYHRGLHRARWSALAASHLLLRLVGTTFAPQGALVFGLDDTLERRRGEHMTAKGIYRDPVRSSHAHVVKASGLRWLCCMLVVKVPWASAIWGLPVLTALCPSERSHTERGRQHQTWTDRAWHIMQVLMRWLPTRTLVFVADKLDFIHLSQFASQLIGNEPPCSLQLKGWLCSPCRSPLAVPLASWHRSFLAPCGSM